MGQRMNQHIANAGKIGIRRVNVPESSGPVAVRQTKLRFQCFHRWLRFPLNDLFFLEPQKESFTAHLGRWQPGRRFRAEGV